MKRTALTVVLAALVASSAASAMDSASYKVQVDATWTAQSHPFDYPSNAHFSGIVGAAHNAEYTIFQDGGTATKGLENLSEMGAHSPLDGEIKAAIDAGQAGSFFESGALFSFPGKLEASYSTDERHPYVSLVAMVAPSPDWFTGVAHVALRKDGKWRDTVSLTLWDWDAGTDHGTTHKAADANAMPRQSIRLAASPNFLGQGGLKPVGQVTFTRTDVSATN